MDITNTKNISPREFQTRIFVENLYKNLDKIASTSEKINNKLSKRANELFYEDNYNEDECVDILIYEGFDSNASRHLVSGLKDKIAKQVPLEKYDYCFENNGKTFSARELGNVIEASSQHEAENLIKENLALIGPSVNLLSITKLN